MRKHYGKQCEIKLTSNGNDNSSNILLTWKYGGKGTKEIFTRGKSSRVFRADNGG